MVFSTPLWSFFYDLFCMFIWLGKEKHYSHSQNKHGRTKKTQGPILSTTLHPVYYFFYFSYHLEEMLFVGRGRRWRRRVLGRKPVRVFRGGGASSCRIIRCRRFKFGGLSKGLKRTFPDTDHRVSLGAKKRLLLQLLVHPSVHTTCSKIYFAAHDLART